MICPQENLMNIMNTGEYTNMNTEKEKLWFKGVILIKNKYYIRYCEVNREKFIQGGKVITRQKPELTNTYNGGN